MWLDSADGTKLHAWLVWPGSGALRRERKEAPVVLFFQASPKPTPLPQSASRPAELGSSFLKAPLFSSSYSGVTTLHTDAIAARSDVQENAGNMSYRLPYVRQMAYSCDCVVLMLSYRGYGSSEGSPSQVEAPPFPLSSLRDLLLPAAAAAAAPPPPPPPAAPCDRLHHATMELG